MLQLTVRTINDQGTVKFLTNSFLLFTYVSIPNKSEPKVQLTCKVSRTDYHLLFFFRAGEFGQWFYVRGQASICLLDLKQLGNVPFYYSLLKVSCYHGQYVPVKMLHFVQFYIQAASLGWILQLFSQPVV